MKRLLRPTKRAARKAQPGQYRDLSGPGLSESLDGALGGPTVGYRDGGKVKKVTEDAPDREMLITADPKRKFDTRIPNQYQGELQGEMQTPEVLDRNRPIRLANGGMVPGVKDKGMSEGAKHRFSQQCKGK